MSSYCLSVVWSEFQSVRTVQLAKLDRQLGGKIYDRDPTADRLDPFCMSGLKLRTRVALGIQASPADGWPRCDAHRSHRQCRQSRRRLKVDLLFLTLGVIPRSVSALIRRTRTELGSAPICLARSGCILCDVRSARQASSYTGDRFIRGRSQL